MKRIAIIAALFAATTIPAAATMTNPDDKPKVAATGAAPSVTAEMLDSISVAVVGLPTDMCPIPAVPPGPSGDATAIILLSPAGETVSVRVRAPVGLPNHFETAARRCVLDRTKGGRAVRVEYHWETKQ